MTLKLYYHPLSSFCWKALIALYENGAAFEPVLVDLQDQASREAFLSVWPIGQFPVIEDGDRLVPESSIIVEYLDQRHPGKTRLIPADPDRARQMRLRDRFFDLHVQVPMQKIVGDRIRPEGKSDPYGAKQARARLETALAMVEEDIGEAWVMGEDFTMADCAAAPALYYAGLVMPLGPKTSAYLERLKARPSFARVLEEAAPYLSMFPQEKTA
jgi:glutathione S-transferase